MQDRTTAHLSTPFKNPLHEPAQELEGTDPTPPPLRPPLPPPRRVHPPAGPRPRPGRIPSAARPQRSAPGDESGSASTNPRPQAHCASTHRVAGAGRALRGAVRPSRPPDGWGHGPPQDPAPRPRGPRSGPPRRGMHDQLRAWPHAPSGAPRCPLSPPVHPVAGLAPPGAPAPALRPPAPGPPTRGARGGPRRHGGRCGLHGRHGRAPLRLHSPRGPSPPPPGRPPPGTRRAAAGTPPHGLGPPPGHRWLPGRPAG